MKIIDPHIHLFALDKGDYHWLKPDQPPFWPDKNKIAKDFSEQDLKLSSGLTLSGFIHIEAGFNNEKPWQEIHWLEQHCLLPFRSIAFLDISQNNQTFLLQLKKLKQYRSVVGVRHILDEEAGKILALPDVLKNFNDLADAGLLFELQMCLNDIVAIKQLTKILKAIPSLKIIINHAGWPPVKTAEQQLWQQGIAQLSQYSQCAIKCSGWEMTDRNYGLAWVVDIITQCINVFGIKRVMLASNFPLCMFSSSYQRYWQKLSELRPNSAKEEYHVLYFDNAKHWYEL